MIDAGRMQFGLNPSRARKAQSGLVKVERAWANSAAETASSMPYGVESIAKSRDGSRVRNRAAKAKGA